MSHFFTLNNIPLRVNQDKGVSVVSGLNIHTTQLKPNDEKHSATHFNNTGYEGKEFGLFQLLLKHLMFLILNTL